MKSFVISVILLASVSSYAASSLPNHKITLQQQKIGLRDMITSLLDETGMKYRLSNNVTNDKKVSVEVKEAKWSEVFTHVMKEGKLNYRVTSKNRILVSP